jgi:hypothetical protein
MPVTAFVDDSRSGGDSRYFVLGGLMADVDVGAVHRRLGVASTSRTCRLSDELFHFGRRFSEQNGPRAVGAEEPRASALRMSPKIIGWRFIRGLSSRASLRPPEGGKTSRHFSERRRTITQTSQRDFAWSAVLWTRL